MKKKERVRKCNICGVVIGDEIDRYVGHLETSNYSPRSIDIYRRALLDLDRFLAQTGIRKPTDINEQDLSDYRLELVERNLKEASMEVYLRATRLLFQWLEANREVFINPAARLVIRAPSRSIRYVPNENEIRALLAAPDTSRRTGLRDRALLETAYATGARREELAGMALSAVNLPDRTIRIIGKGNRERVVPLTICAAEWLGRYIHEGRHRFPGADTDALWLGQRGTFEADGVSGVFVQQSKNASLAPVIRPHAMRRACATHMLRNGASPLEIQKLLGHADLKHLSQYLAVSITSLRQVHSKSRLGG